MAKRIPFLFMIFMFFAMFLAQSTPDNPDGNGNGGGTPTDPNTPGNPTDPNNPGDDSSDSSCPSGQTADSFGNCCADADKDCNGDCFGGVALNCNGECNTNWVLDASDPQVCCLAAELGCDGICGSGAVSDDCGVCGGNNELKDESGVCCPAEEKGCDGLCKDPLTGQKKEFDACGVCEGTNECCRDPSSPDQLCGGNGVCNPAYQGCVCEMGWTGPFCSAPQDPCLGYDCNMRGHCEADGLTPVCVCEEGYTGDRCEAKSCAFRGTYDSVDDDCDCYEPYDAASDCSTCFPPQSDKDERICFSLDGSFFFPKELRKNLAKALLRKGWHKHRSLNYTVISADSEFNGVHYDCGCLPVDNSMVEGASSLERGHKEIANNPPTMFVQFCQYQVYLDALEHQEEVCDDRVRGYISGAVLAGLGTALITLLIGIAIMAALVMVQRKWKGLYEKLN